MPKKEIEIKEYTATEVAKHNNADSLWVTMEGKVYDVTNFVDKHPGGGDVILTSAGKDITELFKEQHSHVSLNISLFIAKNYEIGTLKGTPVLQDVTEEAKSAAAKSKNQDKGIERYNAEYNLCESQCGCVRKQFSQLAEVCGGVIEAGNVLYDSLYNALGTARELFKNPKKAVALKFISQIERFVNHIEDTTFLEAEMYNLSMRHLAYVTHQNLVDYMTIFIGAITSVAKESLDEYWDQASADAWNEFLGFLGGHLLKNALEFGGKVTLLRQSWEEVENIGNASKKNVDENSTNSSCTGGFGEALFFNIGVMSPEITALIMKDRNELANLFQLGFRMLVRSVSDPPVFNEELYILAARHLNYGTEEVHFPVFGQAVMVTLRSLLPRTWNWAHEDAWGWLWALASKFMIQTIANGHAHKGRLDESMERLDGVDMDELGVQFYGILFAASVEVQQYFYKPNNLIKFIISKVLDYMGKLLHKPDETAHGIRALGMRHINYAIPPDLFPLFGVSLVGTLPNFLEGFWDEDICHAFATVFEFVKDCMTRAVTSGTNLVTKALCSNSAKECAAALEVSPRNLRIFWMLELDVSGIKVSPLGWALQDAKVTVAKFMIEDILAIRADREAYYYGKDILFRVHPDIVKLLCQLAPHLIEVVFDGLMWHSRNIEDGKRRVNYYVRDIYGDPHKSWFEDVFDIPLADLVRLNNSDLFTHSLALFVMNLKWTQFARWMYLKTMILNAFILLFFTAGCLVDDPTMDPLIPFVIRTIATVFAAVQLLFIQTPRMIKDIRNGHTAKFLFIPLPNYICHLTNAGRIILNIFLIVSCATDDFVWVGYYNTLIMEVNAWMQGLSICIMWSLLLELSHIFLVMLKFRHKLGAVAAQYMIFVVSLLIVLVGFSAAQVLVETHEPKKDAYSGVKNSILNHIAIVTGIYNFDMKHYNPLMTFLYIAYSVIASFILCRLLLAIMTTITIIEAPLVDGYAYSERVELILELESICTLKQRREFFLRMGMAAPVEFDEGDFGPEGGIQVREAVGRQMTKQAADDRIKRYPGECNPEKAWPISKDANDNNIEDQLDKLSGVTERMRRNLLNLQKKGANKGQAGLPTLSEGESGTGVSENEVGESQGSEA